MIFDVAIIGAGLAGLICGQHLMQAGYRVVVLEKSRGVGGRAATRRLQGTWVDHGLADLELSPQHPEIYRDWVMELLRLGILQPSLTAVYQFSPPGLPQPVISGNPRYYAPLGMSAIAKVLAADLDIQLQQRVTGLHLAKSFLSAEPLWQIVVETPTQAEQPYAARAIVCAVPAPQAADLCLPLIARGLAPEFVQTLRRVIYTPCLSAIAGYAPTKTLEGDRFPWQRLNWLDDPILNCTIIDSCKRPAAAQSTWVFQSSASLATAFMSAASLDSAAQQIFDYAAQHLFPWLGEPEWWQIHRWRYSQPMRPYPGQFIQAPLEPPLICCGDWCGGQTVETAFLSGMATAARVKSCLP